MGPTVSSSAGPTMPRDADLDSVELEVLVSGLGVKAAAAALARGSGTVKK